MRKFNQLSVEEQASAIEKCLVSEANFLSEILMEGQEIPEYLARWKTELEVLLFENDTTPWFLAEQILSMINNCTEMRLLIIKDIMAHIHNAVFLDKEEFVLSI